MVVFPNAKINVGLNVVEKRIDGFHNIETIFYPIPLCDILEFNKASDGIFVFENTGLKIDGETEKNLVVKAFRLVQKDFMLPEIKIHLHKIIPFGAGLGGGSSDASFMLKSLNDYFELRLTNQQLKNYAEMLGSDCPFFIDNVPSFATGKGECLTKIENFLNQKYLILVHPAIHVNTAMAYSGVKPNKTVNSLDELIHRPIVEWRNSITNDFEASVFQRFPEIENIKNRLYGAGAIYVSMTGSGSAVFGIFENEIRSSLTYNFSDKQSYFIWQGKLD